MLAGSQHVKQTVVPAVPRPGDRARVEQASVLRWSAPPMPALAPPPAGGATRSNLQRINPPDLQIHSAKLHNRLLKVVSGSRSCTTGF